MSRLTADRQRADRRAALQDLTSMRDAILTGSASVPTPMERADLDDILGALGITRVADLTDLDRVGLPVWSAYRPDSLGLTVASGKAADRNAAWVSAVMESAEQAMAENAIAVIDKVASQHEMAVEGVQTIQLERHPRCAADRLHPAREIGWTMGMSLATGESVYAPFELVGADMSAASPWDHTAFRMVSVGLGASGNLEGAIRQGISELVEDDTLFSVRFAGGCRQESEAVFCRSTGTAIYDVCERVTAAGIEPLFHLRRSEFGPWTALSALHDPNREKLAYFAGTGCGVTREEAALKALLEAVQTRLIFISGAREDLSADEYRMSLTDSTRATFHRACWTASSGTATAAHDQTLRAILRDGARDVYVFPLGGRSLGFEVVRVLADDLSVCDMTGAGVSSKRAASQLLQELATP